MRSRQIPAQTRVKSLTSLVYVCVVLGVAGALSLPSMDAGDGNSTIRGYYGYHSCISQRTALRRAYYSQLELIRRGLPRIVAQAEYAWAINKLSSIDGYFRYKKSLDSFCIADFIWGRLFDYKYRAWWAIKYIQYIRWHDPAIHFVTYSKQPVLPAMTIDEQEIADRHWAETEQSMIAAPRSKYPLSNFKFPSNVEILYDPFRHEACAEYHKFGSVEGQDVPDAHMVLLQLLVSSIELYRMGADRSDIEKMLRHFVAFCFDGIRCKRHEDRMVKIPHVLHAAYAQNCAYLYSRIVNPVERPLITEEAVETVFKDEVDSLVSYNSWGNTEYAVLTDATSVPKVHNSLSTIFDVSKNEDLDEISGRQMQVGRESVGRSSDGLGTAVHLHWCPFGYIFMGRTGGVDHALEHCCAAACHIWHGVFGFETHATESCCERCNAFRCVGTLTEVDMHLAESTEVMVPEFGERAREFFHMLRVII